MVNEADNVNDMMDLLNDNKTNEKKFIGFAKVEVERFENEVRKVLRKTERDNQIKLLEEARGSPRVKGLPKNNP